MKLLGTLSTAVLLFTAGNSTNTFAQSGARNDSRAYFQQSVHYTLDAVFNDDLKSPQLLGTGSLEYQNNSPDTLRDLYFHLYWNLFRHNSYGERASGRNRDENENYDLSGITIDSLFIQENGQGETNVLARSEVDNTVMRLRLEGNGLQPNSKTVIRFVWHGAFPNLGTRTTWGYHDNGARNFSTAQWYPQICVYDNHGWHPDQYIGKGEFYTDYGSFDVTLSLPEYFTTIVATGSPAALSTQSGDVLNKMEEARSHPDSTVRVSDYSGFNPSTRDMKATHRVWPFHADSVRDFAWCADEAYIWDVIYSNGIMHNALYWDGSRKLWEKEAAKIALHTIQHNSKVAGQYLYPNIFLCETFEGGMEYPGIVFVGPYTDGEKAHWPQNVMMHEMGHEWYPMMIGSNETDYGYMDEGFNTFLTTLTHEAYFGRYNNSYGPGLGYNDDERTANYRGAILEQLSGYQEPSQTKADMFLTYRSYAEATYPHTGSVFFMLRYAMGDSAFAHFLQLYYDRWHFRHPYPDDLRETAEEVDRKEGDTNRIRARGDLRWFFDEWFDKTWKLDYRLDDLSVHGNSADVTVERLERAVMPLDLVFTFDDGSTEQRWIPVDDWLRTVAMERTYHYTFFKHPRHVAINPSNELLDINRLNNASGWLPPMEVSLIPKILGDIKPIDRYAVRSAPYLAPSSGDFLSSPTIAYGWTLYGSYLNRSDRMALGLRLDKEAWQNHDVGGVFQYHTVFDLLTPWSDIDFAAIHADRINFAGFNFSQLFTKPSGERPFRIFDLGYDWSQRLSTDLPPLNRLHVGYSLAADLGYHSIAAAVEFESGVGDPWTNYSKIAGMLDTRLFLTNDWNAFFRVFGGSMQPGESENIPAATLFHLASSSTLDHFQDLYASNFGSDMRAKIRNATVSGPLVRGYFGSRDIQGRVATSATAELGNRSLFPLNLLRKIPYLGEVFDQFGLSFFGDAGVTTDRFCTCRLKGDLRSDFGVGLRLFGDYRFLSNLLNIDPERSEFRLDFPIWLSDPIAGESRYAFRFVGLVRQNF